MAIKYHYEKVIKDALRDQVAAALPPNVKFSFDRIEQIESQHKVIVTFDTQSTTHDYQFIGQDRLMTNEMAISVEIVIKGTDESIIKEKLEEYKYIVYTALMSTKQSKQLGGKVDRMSFGTANNFTDNEADAKIVGVNITLNIFYKQLESDFSSNT